MKNKNKLDDFHYHELLDRCHLVAENIDTHLINHPVCDKEKKIKRKLKKSLRLLTKAYQMIGAKY